MRITVVRVGSDYKPANDKDIEDIQEQLSEVVEGKKKFLVTHHAIDIVQFDYDKNTIEVSKHK